MEKLREMYCRIRRKIAVKKRFGTLCRVLPIVKNKVVFDNFGGKGYGDDPKYICEQLRSQGGGESGMDVRVSTAG